LAWRRYRSFRQIPLTMSDVVQPGQNIPSWAVTKPVV
jgi:hypothetical protein